MKKIQLLLLLLIVFLAPNVFAAEFNMNNYTSATLNGTKNRYGGTEFIYSGLPGTIWTFGTRYNGRLNDIITYFDYPFEKNTTYRFTYNMATNDFNNNFASSYWWDCSDDDPVAHVFIPTYISYKKVQYSITPTENTTCIKVQLYGKNNQEGITQINNWALSSITIYDPDYQSGSGSGQGTNPAPTADPNQSIINNQNNNTQDIINNQNDNTADIISSLQETSQQVSDTITNIFNICNQIDITLTASNNSDSDLIGKYLTSNGSIGDSVSYNISEYIQILPQAHYTLTASENSVNSPAFCIYDSSYTLISCTQFNNQAVHNFETGSNAKYFRTSLRNVDVSYNLHLVSDKVCTNKIDDTNAAINQVNDTLNNDNIDNALGSSFFSDFDDQDFGLSSIITIPLNTIQSLTSKSCVALNVPIPFTNSSVPLPCMTEIYEQNVPTIYNLWKIVSFGLIAYFIAIDIFHMVKGFKDPESDKVEVLDL